MNDSTRNRFTDHNNPIAPRCQRGSPHQIEKAA